MPFFKYGLVFLTSDDQHVPEERLCIIPELCAVVTLGDNGTIDVCRRVVWILLVRDDVSLVARCVNLATVGTRLEFHFHCGVFFGRLGACLFGFTGLGSCIWQSSSAVAPKQRRRKASDFPSIAQPSYQRRPVEERGGRNKQHKRGRQVVRVQRQQEERHAGDDVADDGDIPRHAGMMRSNRWRCSAGMARLDGTAAKGAIKIGQRNVRVELVYRQVTAQRQEQAICLEPYGLFDSSLT